MKATTAIRALATTLGVGLALAASIATGSALAGGLPSLLSGIYCGKNYCTGVYKTRPHTITALNDPQGGTLKGLSWSSWTTQSAAATGTAVVSNMGNTVKTPVTVAASRVRNGLYTRMTITFSAPGLPVSVEKLSLVGGSSPSWRTTSQTS